MGDNIYSTYIKAKKSLNKEVDNNDGFKRIFSNGTIKNGKSYCSEVRTESYTKKPFKGDSFSEEKPRWFKEEDENTKEEKVDSGENKEPENTSDDNKQQKEQTTTENNNQESSSNSLKEKEETANKTLNTVLEDINQLINTASSKLDGPFTYGSMADYLSEVITKSLLLLAIDEDTSQNINNTYTQQNKESEEKEIDISNNSQENNSENNNGTTQNQPKEEKKL